MSCKKLHCSSTWQWFIDDFLCICFVTSHIKLIYSYSYLISLWYQIFNTLFIHTIVYNSLNYIYIYIYIYWCHPVCNFNFYPNTNIAIVYGFEFFFLICKPIWYVKNLIPIQHCTTLHISLCQPNLNRSNMCRIIRERLVSFSSKTLPISWNWRFHFYFYF